MVALHSHRTLAVALVVLLALGGLGVAGPASGQELSSADAMLDSGSTAWQGQQLQFDGSRVVSQTTGDYPSQLNASQREFSLRRLHDDNTVGRSVRTITVNRSGVAVVSTTRLDGRYVLTYDERPVAVDDGDGSLRIGVSGGDLRACSWTVTDDTANVTGSFDRTTENGTVVLGQRSSTAISGETDLPQGTEIVLRIHGEGARPFLLYLETDLGPDGRFNETVDLTGTRYGAPVSITLSLDGSELTRREGVVGGVTTETTTREPSTTRPSTSSSPTTTTSPGFGVGGAVGGVVGLALVATVAAVRRTR
jgi:hypothetical protein